MRTDVLIVARPDRRPRIECRGGLQGRCTSADTVHLVSTAATPLGGDEIQVRLVVDSGARLRLRSAAATVALPGADSTTSHARWEIDVSGCLDLELEPTIIAANARHFSEVTLALTGSCRVRLRERIQIGRSDERQGFWSGTLHVDIDGQPLLRHRVELGAGSLADDAIGAPRAMVSEFGYPAEASDAAGGPTGTLLELAGGGYLATWQGGALGR